jgi:hypothetical protein
MARIVRRGPDSTVADSPVESGRPQAPVRMLPVVLAGEGTPT